VAVLARRPMVQMLTSDDFRPSRSVPAGEVVGDSLPMSNPQPNSYSPSQPHA